MQRDFARSRRYSEYLRTLLEAKARHWVCRLPGCAHKPPTVRRHMTNRSVIGALSTLLASSLLAVGCNDSLSPNRSGPGRPEFWGGGGQVATKLKFIVQPHPNPAQPALLQTVGTQVTHCVPQDPTALTPGSRFATDVQVQDAAS